MARHDWEILKKEREKRQLELFKNCFVELKDLSIKIIDKDPPDGFFIKDNVSKRMLKPGYVNEFFRSDTDIFVKTSFQLSRCCVVLFSQCVYSILPPACFNKFYNAGNVLFRWTEPLKKKCVQFC